LERHHEGRGDDGIGSSVTKSDSTGKKIVESNLDYFRFIQELFSHIRLGLVLAQGINMNPDHCIMFLISRSIHIFFWLHAIALGVGVKVYLSEFFSEQGCIDFDLGFACKYRHD